MQTYQSMKDSGVAWLGYIPSEWEQKQARYIFKQAKDPVGIDPSKYELLSLTLRGIIPRSQVDGGKNPENYNTYQIVHENDLIMCLFDYDVTPRTVGRATTTGMVTGAYTNLRPLKGVSTRYYNYFFLALDTTKELLHLCTGLRNGISKPTFFSLNLPVPSYETQVRIANYLDEEIKKIDTLINKQERLLELLEEKRVAGIIRLVTQGTICKVDTKDSGILGIGSIPSHWEVVRSMILFSETKDSNTDLVSTEAMKYKFGKIVSKELPTDFDFNELRRYTIVRENDIMVNGLNLNYDFVTQRVALVENVGCITPAYIALRPRSMIRPKYATLLLKSLDSQKILNGWGTGIRLTLNFSEFKKTYLCLPPINEQDEIVKACESVSDKYEALSSKIRKQLLLLKERRISLISNVVTGKVKV